MANRLRQTVQSIEGTPAEQIAGKASKDIDMRAGLDNLAGFISNTYNSMSNLDKAALFTAPFPVLGDIVGFSADTKTFIEDPTLTNAGLGIAGLLPFVPSGTLIRAAKKGYGGVKEGDILGAGVGGLNTLASGAKKIGSELSNSRVTERLFHGTPIPDIKKLKPSKEGVLGDGVYLTPDPKFASSYAEGDTGNVIPVFAKLTNPLRIKHQGDGDPSAATLIALGVPKEKAFKIVEKAYEEKGNITKQISSRAKKQGYDSIILENKEGGIQEIVSYRPDNIYPTTDSAENISKETQNFVDRMLEKDIYPNDPEFYKLQKEFIEDVEIVNRYAGGSVVERNPYANYQLKAI